MSDKKIIVANWKMRLTIDESLALAREYRERFAAHGLSAVAVTACPSFEALSAAAQVFKGSSIMLGAQDLFWQERGAYTGEISGSMLRAVGCSSVIVGHSERRKYLNEDDAMVNAKVRAALGAGLAPVLCVGETYEERRENHTDLVIMRQVIEGLKGIPLKPDQHIVLAYEPVWVIGTGQAIDPDMADHATQVIKQALIDLYPLDIIARQTRILYGGSVDDENINDFLALPLISGALVGAASIDSDLFFSMVAKVS